MKVTKKQPLYDCPDFNPPLFLLTSVKTPGANFYEVVQPFAGSWDSGATKVGIAVTFGPLKLRLSCKRTFDYVSPGPRLAMPGDHIQGDWEGVAATLILSFSEDHIRNVIHSTGALLRPAGFENTTGTRVRPAGSEYKAAKVEHILQLIRSDVKAGSPAGPPVFEFLASEIIGSLFSKVEIPASEKGGTRAQIEAIRDYIEANLCGPLSLTDLAFVAGMSMRHMCRAFRSASGCAPYAYILRRRVERARDLIAGSAGMTLTEIAFAVGFSSQSHMAWAFQKTLGKSPSHFRTR